MTCKCGSQFVPFDENQKLCCTCLAIQACKPIVKRIKVKCSCGREYDSMAYVSECLQCDRQGCNQCEKICPVCNLKLHTKHFRKSKKYGKKGICWVCKKEHPEL